MLEQIFGFRMWHRVKKNLSEIHPDVLIYYDPASIFLYWRILKGMVGTALCNNLKNIRDEKNKTRPELTIENIYEYDLDSTLEELDEYCQKSDFVFNLAGVNRPENPEDFMKGNFGFASDLLNCLKKHHNKATIMAEVLHQNLSKIEASDIHTRLGLEKGKYILLSAHREENIDTEKNFTSLFTAINEMAEKYDMPILYSCHPRSRKRLEQSGFVLDKRVIQHEPLGFHDYNCLQMNAFCVVSDSGTLPEESSFFTSVGHSFPAVCIRTSTERPEALDKGDFILAGIDGDHLLQAVDVAVEMNKNRDLGIPVPDYVDENVSDKVVKIIQSYTGVVDKMVCQCT